MDISVGSAAMAGEPDFLKFDDGVELDELDPDEAVMGSMEADLVRGHLSQCVPDSPYQASLNKQEKAAPLYDETEEANEMRRLTQKVDCHPLHRRQP